MTADEMLNELCPRCDGELYEDEDKLWTCRICGCRWKITADTKTIVEES